MPEQSLSKQASNRHHAIPPYIQQPLKALQRVLNTRLIGDSLGTPFLPHQLRVLTQLNVHVHGEERSELILNSQGSLFLLRWGYGGVAMSSTAGDLDAPAKCGSNPHGASFLGSSCHHPASTKISLC